MDKMKYLKNIWNLLIMALQHHKLRGVRSVGPHPKDLLIIVDCKLENTSQILSAWEKMGCKLEKEGKN